MSRFGSHSLEGDGWFDSLWLYAMQWINAFLQIGTHTLASGFWRAVQNVSIEDQKDLDSNTFAVRQLVSLIPAHAQSSHSTAQ